MASLLFPDDERSVPPLLIPPPPDERGPLAPDPRADAFAQATGQVYQRVSDYIAKQQQDAVDRGLWEGGQVWEGGHPTGGGVLDALHTTAEGVAMGTTSSGGGKPGFTAYHGSPHKFPPTARNPLGEFDPARIGTGEGAQAYGVGAGYLAEREGIAKGYKDQLSPSTDAVSRLIEKHGGDTTAAMTEGLNSGGLTAAEFDALRAYEKTGRLPPRGHMYEVRVHADPKRFLHWDKPLSEQHPDVQAALRPMLSRDQYRNMTEGAWARTPVSTAMPSLTTADTAARLSAAGVPGIRYLDQGSRGAGEGSHNAVVFSPETMEIIRRYGIAGLMLGGGGLLAPNQQQER